MNTTGFIREITMFHDRMAPEIGLLVGYGAIIDAMQLPVPLPRTCALISTKNRHYTTSEWLIFTPRYKPADTLYDQLVFALKYEGVNLIFFKIIFETIGPATVESWIRKEPLSQYCRRIWFLYEWLMHTKLSLPDLESGNYIPLLEEKLQYVSPQPIKSSRHRVNNNVPGTVGFCPLIHRTPKLDRYLAENLSSRMGEILGTIHKDTLRRTSAYLMLKDSKASFRIEGEESTQARATRWGKANELAGKKPLTKDELLRLQEIIIEDSRFTVMGYRTEGGFVGEHDRHTGAPIPEHISARWEDVDDLITGLITTASFLETCMFHPVLSAAAVAFGFVYIHPFADGNGRLHRYVIHHLLSAMKFTPQGIIFPVSSAILEKIDEYRTVLETYSRPLLDCIEWRPTAGNNVEVLNKTIDYYRYFDATVHAEFLFECIEDTITRIIPEEVTYLEHYDRMKTWLDERFQMPNSKVALLIRFLEQNNSTLSKRAVNKEFQGLTEQEVKEIEEMYQSIVGV